MPRFPCVGSENTHKLAPASDLAGVELGRMTALQAAAGEKVAYQAALLRVNVQGCPANMLRVPCFLHSCAFSAVGSVCGPCAPCLLSETECQ